MKSCNDCKFAIFQDYGYSNYTVEGTEFFCGRNAHPAGHFDRFYGTDKRLGFAEECSDFESGEAIYMDVDSEDYADLTAEQKRIYGERHSR